MNKYFVIATLLFTTFLSHSYSITCKLGQNYVSRFDSTRQLSEEEIDGAYEYVDVVSHMDGEIDGTKYSLNKSMELFKHSGKAKAKILKFNTKMYSDNTIVSFFKFGNYHFFEIGSNDFVEGYISSIYITDLKNKKVLSNFNKCSNNNEFFGLKDGILTYMCEWHCQKDKYFTFSPKDKKFIPIKKKHDCKKLKPSNKLVGIKQYNFKLRYKKNKEGIEFKSSRLPLIEKNCK